METRNRWKWTLFVVSLLGIIILGCGTGYSFTYPARFGDAGQVIVRNDSIEGNSAVQVQIDEDFAWDQVVLDITVAVESGDLQAVFTDDNGQTLSLSATAGQPASGHVEMETDARGNINLQLSGEGARSVTIKIEFDRK